MATLWMKMIEITMEMESPIPTLAKYAKPDLAGWELLFKPTFTISDTIKYYVKLSKAKK